MVNSSLGGLESTSPILTLAIEIASRLPYRYRHCAIVTDKRERVLSIATNSYTKTHPIQRRFARLASKCEREYLHAEIAAIIRVRSGEPRRIYVARHGATGAASSAPCEICRLAIAEAGITEIIHT